MGTPRRAAVLVTALVSSLATAFAPAGNATPGAAPAAASPYRPGHVFVIVIENKTFDEAYVSNPNPYLRTTLPARGQLLTRFYGTAHRSLPNYLAQLSGQAPNPSTQHNCARYVDFVPAAKDPLRAYGQLAGDGCVYPATVQTLPDQLDARGISWKAYMGDMGNDPRRAPARCGAPGDSAGKGVPDTARKATATDAYATRHNPFVYFRSIRDSPRCATHVVPLTALAADLAAPARFTWITPNLCDDGHDKKCAGTNVGAGRNGGLRAVDLFLRKYVPMIEASPAYKRDGLLIVTSDESESDDAGACCGELPGPNVTRPGRTGPGGGLIGTVVLGKCVRPGSRNPTPYNHYSFLRSMEDIYGIRTGGADGKGHLGFAAQAGLRPFGADVFGGCRTKTPTPTATPAVVAAPTAGPVATSLPAPPVDPVAAARSSDGGNGVAWFLALLGALAAAAVAYVAVRRGAKPHHPGRHRG